MKKNIVVGVDSGKTTMSVSLGMIKEDGTISNIISKSERHYGEPVEHFIKFYKELDINATKCIVATGIYSDRLKEPIISDIPEEIAQDVAINMIYGKNNPINVVRLGGRGYSIFTVDNNGNVRYEENDKCSAGTGETVEKICGRLGVSLEEAIQMAEQATTSIPISARCSVFAKSEMTHYANQGEKHENLISGYFESISRNLISLYEKCKVDGPVILIGNGANIKPISDSFAKSCSSPVTVSNEADVFEAIGAMYIAAENAMNNPIDWPVNPDELLKENEKKITSLAPGKELALSVKILKDDSIEPKSNTPAIIGLDIGSTGSKGVLIDYKTGDIITDMYIRTDGNPVEAAKKLVLGITEKNDHPITAIGLTGSGRNAAAAIFKAAYSDTPSQIYVENEIVAHATAAIKYDEHNGESLSIVEIGGQDAKFINIQGGQIIESDMNRACSAGTGSFLEEQAIFYGIDDINEFGTLASAAKSPPDLGQMCTVFIADLASEALNEGYKLEDIFAGFQYSVIVNYKSRVMGNRQFMDRIFFQGKPATNQSLAQTLSAVTKREVIVPPNPGAMGAVGIALLTGESINDIDTNINIEKIKNSNIISNNTFNCKDPQCQNLCRIDSVNVQVENATNKVVSGGRCPKYEEATTEKVKLPKDAPNPYLERENLLTNIIKKYESKEESLTIGLPYGNYLMEYIPFFYTFFSELGFNVEVLRSNKDTYELGNKLTLAFSTCTPTKIMHGLVEQNCDIVFMPKIVHVTPDKKGMGTITCPFSQSTPELVDLANKKKGENKNILRPIFDLAKGFKSNKFKKKLENSLNDLSELLSDEQNEFFNLHSSFSEAFRAACQSQKKYSSDLDMIGYNAIDFAKKNDIPIVLIIGSLHVIHEPIMNAGIHNIVSNNGAIALPIDCYPIPDSIPTMQRMYSASVNKMVRAAIASVENGNIFPAYIVSYGCGPGSFEEYFLNDIAENYPHTILESDGHGGQAGYVTRVAAFLHTIRNYNKEMYKPVPDEKIQWYNRKPEISKKKLYSSELYIPPSGGAPELGSKSTHMVTILTSKGFNTHFTGFADMESFICSRESCSGKECFPYSLLWGNYIKYLKENVDNKDEDDVSRLLLSVTGYGPCSVGMWQLGYEISLKKLGYNENVKPFTFGEFLPFKTITLRFFCSVVAIDLLTQMRLHFLPLAQNIEDCDNLFKEYMDKVDDVFAACSSRNSIVDVYFLFKTLDLIGALMIEAGKKYKNISIIPEREKDLRTVYLVGDALIRNDDWGNDNMIRKFNKYGIRVLQEPTANTYESYAFYRKREILEFDDRFIPNFLQKNAMRYISHKLYEATRTEFPDIYFQNIKSISETSKEFTDGFPFGPEICNSGSTYMAWCDNRIDGVVKVAGIACPPGLITESLLRSKPELPILYIYNDGDPINEDRVSGFAMRLKRTPTRVKMNLLGSNLESEINNEDEIKEESSAMTV